MSFELKRGWVKGKHIGSNSVSELFLNDLKCLALQEPSGVAAVPRL